MRPAVAGTFALLVLFFVTACGGETRRAGKPASDALPPSWPNEPTTYLGFVRSLTPLGPGYKLQLDLHAQFGPNATGLSACIDNHECAPGTKGFLDDTWDHDFHFVVTYYVPPDATVALVGSRSNIPRVTARYLYGMAHGLNPRHVQAMTGTGKDVLREFAFAVRVVDAYGPRNRSSATDYDEVDRMDQLYHP